MNAVRVFLLTGQSNSLGTSADPSETEPSAGHDPRDASIRFFWANRSTRAGDGPAVLIGTSEGRIQTLRIQQGEGANPVFWGPEIGFGRTLAAAGMENIFIIKASRGGGGNSFWKKDAADNHMYRHVVETATEALHALPSATAFCLEALLYVQGESDNDEEARESGQRLRRLAENLRQDLPCASGMQVLVGGIAAPGERRDIVRAQQAALPRQDASFRYVDTCDLQPQLYDALHFNKTAKLELGRRLACLWLSKPEPA